MCQYLPEKSSFKMKQVCLAIFGVCVLVQFVYGADLNVQKSNDDDDDDGTHQIIQGNCFRAVAADLVFHDHVSKWLIPFVKRNATASWHGDQRIYCLEVLNQDDDLDTSGTAFVKEGGVGHAFVTVEMHSKRSHGMEFDVLVYGRYIANAN